MGTSQFRLKYLAWLLPAATLVLSFSIAERGFAQRGVPVGAGVQGAGVQPAAQVPAGQGGGPPRSGPPPARPGSGWGEWWKDELIIKELQLSPQKVRRIDAIFQDRNKRMSGVVDELPIEQAKLEQLARERTVDEATYALQVARVTFLRSQRDQSRQVMLYRLSLELTPEQHKKLLEIRDRGGRGRGGTHGER